MSRRAAMAAVGLVVLLAVLEVGTGWYGERRARRPPASPSRPTCGSIAGRSP